MEAASGIYTRIIFPDALSKEEPHLSDLQKAMLDATPDCIKVVSPDGILLTMNRAGCRALGIPEDSTFGMEWLPLLPEEVHPLGSEALRRAGDGHPARFPGKSISADGIRYWDNLLTPLVDASGSVLSILCVSRDTTEKTILEKQLEEAAERQRLLAQEMQHRIKNLFAMVSGLIIIAEREAASVGSSRAATAILRDKLTALSRASNAVFAHEPQTGFDSEAVDLDALVRSVLQPYGDRCTILGNSSPIPHSAVTTLALFLHEMATNSMKYGGLSVDTGRARVQWALTDKGLDLEWTETGGPIVSSTPGRRGFGSEMVDRIVRSSGGDITRSWKSEGLVAKLWLPVPQKDSAH